MTAETMALLACTRLFGLPARMVPLVLAALLGAMMASPAKGAVHQTPLEASDYKVLPKTEAVVAFLQTLADGSPNAKLEIIGRSALGLPIAAFSISERTQPTARPLVPGERLTVLLIGSQHGTEPSGAEALQILARELASGRMASRLTGMNVVMVPVANPDGRDHHHRANGNNINLSTDYLVQTQPETRALVALIRRVKPQVILDIHESAIYKPRSLGAEGFVTEVETQFEIPTHPNIPEAILTLAKDKVLPRILGELKKSGLRVARYIGEITDIAQPITHGGLTLRNLRNYAGMVGTLGMTLENRLDPPGKYPTPRNIKNRVERQLQSITGFLSVIEEQRREILRVTGTARRNLADSPGQRGIALVTRYVTDEAQPVIRLPMATVRHDERGRIVVGPRITREFPYHGRITAEEVIVKPRAYVVTAFQPEIAALLERNGITFETLPQGRTARLEVQRVIGAVRRPLYKGQVGTVLEVTTSVSRSQRRLRRGDLWIDLDQPLGRLVPLMLDPRSSTSIYQDPAFASHIRVGQDHYTAAVP